jgi:hypothetical protein
MEFVSNLTPQRGISSDFPEGFVFDEFAKMPFSSKNEENLQEMNNFPQKGT